MAALLKIFSRPKDDVSDDEPVPNNQHRKPRRADPGLICEFWFRNIIGNTVSISHISGLVVSYYPFDVLYSGKFIHMNCGAGIEVVNDHEIKFHANSPGGAYKSAKLDTPMVTNLNCLYLWQIALDGQEGTLGGFDVFGVVSNKCNNIGKCPWGLYSVYEMKLRCSIFFIFVYDRWFD